MRRSTFQFVVLIFAFAITAAVTAQTNLLLNPTADLILQYWRTYGGATIDEINGNKVFTIRNGGYFLRDVPISASATGKYELLVGRGSSERVDPDRAITGLPSLYGYMMADLRGGKISTYLTAQQMLGKPVHVNEWVTLYGVFQIPKETVAIRLFLNQAERRGVPHNGSATRFDDLGLYMFETEDEALVFAKAYR